MHRELLDALSVITEEEQRILEEQKGGMHWPRPVARAAPATPRWSGTTNR